MAIAVGAALAGLVIATLAIGIPRWISYRSSRSQPHDLFDRDAYEQVTGRSAADIAADSPGATSAQSEDPPDRQSATRAGDHQGPVSGSQEPERAHRSSRSGSTGERG